MKQTPNESWDMIDWQVFLLRKRTATLREVYQNPSFGEQAQKAAFRILEDRGLVSK